jgi:hypothetical protein
MTFKEFYEEISQLIGELEGTEKKLAFGISSYFEEYFPQALV